MMPTRKVVAQSLGGALAVLVMLTTTMIWDIEFPDGYEGALTVVLGALVGYLTPERPPQG